MKIKYFFLLFLISHVAIAQKKDDIIKDKVPFAIGAIPFYGIELGSESEMRSVAFSLQIPLGNSKIFYDLGAGFSTFGEHTYSFNTYNPNPNASQYTKVTIPSVGTMADFSLSYSPNYSFYYQVGMFIYSETAAAITDESYETELGLQLGLGWGLRYTKFKFKIQTDFDEKITAQLGFGVQLPFKIKKSSIKEPAHYQNSQFINNSFVAPVNQTPINQAPVVIPPQDLTKLSIEELEQLKAETILKEDYKKASLIQQELKTRHPLTIEELEKLKQEAIAKEDYIKAKKIKEQIEKLKNLSGDSIPNTVPKH